MTAFVELHPAGPLVKTLPGEMDQQVAELATEWQRSEGSAGCLRFLRLTEGWSAEKLVNGLEENNDRVFVDR